MTKRRKRRERAPAPPSRPPRPQPRLALAASACFVLALALYWISLGHPLVFDDRLLREDFLRLYGASWFKLDLRWLSYATFGWTYDVIGKQWLWHRLLSIACHAATSALLFSFLARLFAAVLATPAGDGRIEARWIAFFGALIFLLHPVAVYGVAYLVQRPIVMATLFSVLSLRFFLEGLLRQSRPWHYAAVAAYFAAVFSKEHALMLPAVAAALAVLVRGQPARTLRELAIPFALFAGIALLVILKARGVLGEPYEPAARAMLAQLRESPTGAGTPDALLASAVNQGFLYFRYLLTWIIPNPAWMSVDVRIPFPAHWLAWPQTAGFVAWLALPVLAFMLLRRGGVQGLLGFGLLYPWLFALTEFTVVRIQEPYVLYRSYLWMSGLPCLLPALICRLRAPWAFTLLGAACVVLVPLSLNRIETFSGAIRLWDDAVRKNTDETAPYIERGYQQRGLAYLQAGQYPDALRDFERAMALNPKDSNALVGRGTLHARTGNPERALADLDRAVEIDPSYAEAWSKRCFTKMLLDRPRDALPDCEKAVILNPRHRDGHTNLGVVYAALNRPGDAEASYRRALEIEPSNADANFNYGVLLVVLNRRGEAQQPLSVGCDARIAEACKLLAAIRRPR
jgi:tetratricopeptide (TPR) repeat protein